MRDLDRLRMLAPVTVHIQVPLRECDAGLIGLRRRELQTPLQHGQMRTGLAHQLKDQGARFAVGEVPADAAEAQPEVAAEVERERGVALLGLYEVEELKDSPSGSPAASWNALKKVGKNRARSSAPIWLNASCVSCGSHSSTGSN